MFLSRLFREKVKMDRILQLYDKERKQIETKQRQLYQEELPVYREWERILRERYRKFKDWGKPCTSRETEEQCTGSKTKQRVNKSAIRCSFEKFWFSGASCVSDSEQRDRAVEELLMFCRHPAKKTSMPILPFLGFIGDLIFELSQTSVKLHNAETALSKNSIDYDVVVFYFLWKLEKQKTKSTVVHDLLRTQPEKLNLILDLIGNAEISLLRRLECIDELFVLPKPKIITSSTSGKRTKLSVNWIVFLTPLLLLGGVEAETTGSTSQLVVSDQSYLQLVKNRNEIETSVTEYHQQENNNYLSYYNTLDSVKLAETLSKRLAKQEVLVQEHINVFDRFNQNLHLFVPTENVIFEKRVKTLATYGTQIIKYISLIHSWNEYQIAQHIWISNRSKDTVPKFIGEKIIELGDELSKQVAPGLLSDPSTFRSIFGIVIQPYESMYAWNSNDQKFMLNKIQSLLSHEIKQRKNEDEVKDIQEAARFLQYVKEAVDKILGEKVREEKNREKGITTSLSTNTQLLNVGITHAEDLATIFKADYDIDISDIEVAKEIEKVNTLFSSTWSQEKLNDFVAIAYNSTMQNKLLESELEFNKKFPIKISNDYIQNVLTNVAYSLLVLGIVGVLSYKASSVFTNRNKQHQQRMEEEKQHIVHHHYHQTPSQPVINSHRFTEKRIVTFTRTVGRKLIPYLAQIIEILPVDKYVVQLLTNSLHTRKIVGGTFAPPMIAKDSELSISGEEDTILKQLRIFDSKQ